ncbi:uncharacterized protein [Euphorbia lathyris]|uniref:uncharacterized protein isoform X2 n=1 Tax=Euphorbia lathyris TaxID=212925 RepID=UPI003313DF59
MAPRGRPRKPRGQTRMDAAIDAMKCYGFPEKLIVATIKELLDVYGLEGWPFIEEAAYKVLLENILEKVENQANDKEKDESLQSDDEAVDNTLVSPAGSSITSPGPTTHSNREVFPIELPQETASEVTEVLENAKLTEESVCNAYSSNAEGEVSSWNENNQTNNIRGTEAGISFAFPYRSRGPYHGWISDSDEPLELIELKPARLADEFADLLSGTNVPKTRKRRWDVMPQEDIRAL